MSASEAANLAEELPGEDRTVLLASGLAIAVVIGIALNRPIRRFVAVWRELAARNADLDEVCVAYSPAWLSVMVLGPRDGALHRDRIV